jgi:hypothetical protein
VNQEVKGRKTLLRGLSNAHPVISPLSDRNSS